MVLPLGRTKHSLIFGICLGHQDLKKDSGARIDISKEPAEEGSSDRFVNITGPPECVEYAKKKIEDLLGKSKEGTRVKTEDEDGVSTVAGGRVIKVPLESIGVLIGKGGETISKIQKDSHARIEISRDDKDSRERSVTITGSGDAIEKAIRAIDDVLDAAERAGKGSRRRGGDPREGALVPVDRKPSPVKDSWTAEKVYIDEVEMPYRPNYVPEHEDGLPTDLEIFIKGLPKVCAERDLWEHLYRLGATDVKEILLLRRQKQSKGMAYVVFNRHEHAVLAKNKLHGIPASSIPCGESIEQQVLQVRFSESERCINGRSNVYGADMPVLLMGPRGRAMVEIKEGSGLRKVALTGRNMKTFGQVDDDPRMHLVVYYEDDDPAGVLKAVELWGKQLSEIHREIVERSKGKGKGKGWPWMPPPYFDGRPPYGPPPYRPPGPPPYGPVPHMPPMHAPPEPLVDAPVLLTRRRLVETTDGLNGQLSNDKVVEATSLRGRELRWQPWPEVSNFNGDWKVIPLKWGLRGELFVLLRHRTSGETKVCAAEVQNSLEKWPVLHSNSEASSSAKYKSFTFNEHLFVISIDRESGALKVFHVPDPSSAWNVAFETKLPEDPKERPDFPLSRFAKLCVFYGVDRRLGSSWFILVHGSLISCFVKHIEY